MWPILLRGSGHQKSFKGHEQLCRMTKGGFFAFKTPSGATEFDPVPTCFPLDSKVTKMTFEIQADFKQMAISVNGLHTASAIVRLDHISNIADWSPCILFIPSRPFAKDTVAAAQYTIACPRGEPSLFDLNEHNQRMCRCFSTRRRKK